MMEIFEKPELLNFLCDGEFNDFTGSPTDTGTNGGEDGDL